MPRSLERQAGPKLRGVVRHDPRWGWCRAEIVHGSSCHRELGSLDLLWTAQAIDVQQHVAIWLSILGPELPSKKSHGHGYTNSWVLYATPPSF